MGQPSFTFNEATGPTYIIRHEGQKADAEGGQNLFGKWASECGHCRRECASTHA